MRRLVFVLCLLGASQLWGAIGIDVTVSTDNSSSSPSITSPSFSTTSSNELLLAFVCADAKSAGRFKGNAAISVTLTAVRVNGEEYKLRTSEVTEAGKGRGKRTAVGAGGGAVVGGLIGALAGGGKGAAIGAGAGAGVGTAGTALTGNRDITIAPETMLRFKLREPLEVRKN